jgi:hypothetical protein
VDELRSYDRMVAQHGGKLWYWVVVGVQTMVRVRELASGQATPDWRLAEQAGHDAVRLHTPEPEWFRNLDVSVRGPLARGVG